VELRLIHEPAHYPAMNRLAAWTVAAVIAAAVAVFDLASAWASHLSVVLLVLTLGLFGIALALFGALVVAGFGERRRIITGAASSIDLVSRAARGVRWSALAAVALSVLLFANCSASVTSGPTPTSSAAIDDISGLLRVGAETLMPIILVIVLAAALATAAQVLASRNQWRSAHRAAQAAVWSAVAIAVVAVVTVPIGFIFGVAYCDVGGSPGACAGGLASFGDVFLAGTTALLLPYILLLVRALKAGSSPASGSGATG
jgi:hypothetical protein